jgi:hypothetical protein
MLASSLSTPELELTEDEAHKVAVASANVAEHYSVSLDPKTAAWIQLGMVCGSVYGSRIVAIYVRRQMESDEQGTPPKAEKKTQTNQSQEIYPPGVFDPLNNKLAN